MSSPAPLRLLVEGWRFIPHSHGLVNQFQLLELARDPQISLAHRELPYCRPDWKQVPGLLSAEEEMVLRSIRSAEPNETFDAIYTIRFPYDFKPSKEARRTFVFCVAEFGVLQQSNLSGTESLGWRFRDNPTIIITPSDWSRQGIIRSGVTPDQVAVVPHGVDINRFKPVSAEQRTELRKRFNMEGFVFLNVGAMGDNKGIDILLKAFAIVSQTHPQIRLLLKGLDSIYRSKEVLPRLAQSLTPEEIQHVQPRLRYEGATIPYDNLAELYQASDAYVSPYFAEGFNLPVLEATACGTPVICTAGGPTDEFTREDFTLRINSAPIGMRLNTGQQGFARRPSLDHLVTLMKQAIEDASVAQRARTVGAPFVAERYTWAHVAAKLKNVLFGDQFNF